VASLDLPGGQEELVNAVAALGKPLVVVVFAGRPVTLTRIIQKADALLYAWHPGSLGAAAVADVVFGDVNPGGKLPVTFPRAEGQIPIHYNHKSTGRFSPRYLDMPAEPLFPFGFGLSYTTFAYQGLEVQPVAISPGESVKVSVTVTNTGSSAGEEVVQCYVQDCVSGLTRPVKELKGFTRLTLKPGESRRVEFILGPNELSYYGPGGKWVLEPGEFKVGVGGDCLVGLDKSFVVREQ
jgi:beta-glucosidase